MTVTYGQLCATGPHYRARYWQDLRALYDGGDCLLGNPEVLGRLLPQQPYEEDHTYQLRRDRAIYIPYAGSLVNYLVSSLGAEPVTVTGKPDLDPFYGDFFNAVDGKRLTLQELLKKTFCTALKCKVAWCLVDLPPLDSGAVIESRKDEEELGADRAVVFPIEPESILDYEESPSGDLEWAIICMRSQPRASVTASRSEVLEQYTVYDKTSWVRYDIRYRVGEPPKPDDIIPPSDEGAHTFGRVPLIRLELPVGLWAMDQVANIAKAHFNLRSSVAWSQSRALYPLLAAFLGSEIATSTGIPAEVAQNPSRATDQIYGVGRVLQFGDKDKLEYVSPDPALYTAAYADLESLRDEIYRVLNNMALAANTNKSISRSGKSKEMDRAAAQVVLVALGILGREFIREVYDTVSAGRKDPETVFEIHGLQLFDTSTISDIIEDAAIIDSLKIPSETFQRIRIGSVAKRVVGGIATPEQLEDIDEELERNITAEEFAGALPTSTNISWTALDEGTMVKEQDAAPGGAETPAEGTAVASAPPKGPVAAAKG